MFWLKQFEFYFCSFTKIALLFRWRRSLFCFENILVPFVFQCWREFMFLYFFKFIWTGHCCERVKILLPLIPFHIQREKHVVIVVVVFDYWFEISKNSPNGYFYLAAHGNNISKWHCIPILTLSGFQWRLYVLSNQRSAVVSQFLLTRWLKAQEPFRRHAQFVLFRQAINKL